MAEYIEREALMQRMGEFFSPVNTVEQALMLNHTLKVINVFPTADVAPVVHGRWISLTECANAGVYCSVCQKKVWKEDYAWCNKKNKLRSNYCPNCGAKMDAEVRKTD